jgi:nucleoside-diphosphate-sugar epimerase
MKILFIGGTGFISTAVSRLALARGIELFHLNRGKRESDIAGVQSIIADVHAGDQARQALGDQTWDVVVEWIAYTVADIERDLALLRGRTKQFIFISSASAYQKPPSHPIITESTPLYNPYWLYSQNKIACELRLGQAHRDEGFPITIVRPSLTYDQMNFPIAIGGWNSYTLVDRLKTGRPIIVHGDGSSLWVDTQSEDFARGLVGLQGNGPAFGHAIHITSDEVLTWNQIYEIIADAAGAKPNLVHIASDFIRQVSPDIGDGLLGDKAWSVIFDNTKIKTFVPGFQAVIPFRDGIRRSLAWYEADRQRCWIDKGVNEEMDKILTAYSELPNQ